MQMYPIGAVCGSECLTTLINEGYEKNRLAAAKQASRIIKRKAKEVKRQDTKKKKELTTRSQWYSRLQALVNQFTTKVRDVNKGCYTCGKTNDVKYDAGHRYHAGRGGGDRRRFVLENLHKQCSVQCNQHGGGMPVEYDKALDVEYGEGFAEYLKCEANYPTLKEQFPTWQDIEAEIIRYRQLLRDNGIKPNA